MSSDIENQISQIEQSIASTTEQLDRYVNEFASQLPLIAKEWMEKEMARVIQTHASQINEMGADRVREFKAKLAALYEQLPSLCNNANADQAQWPHRRASAALSPHSRQNNDSYFGGVFRKVIEHLGALLAEYKFLTSAQGGVGNWQRVNSGHYKYVAPSLFDDRSMPTLATYERHYGERYSLEVKLRERREALQKAKAQALWDNA